MRSWGREVGPDGHFLRRDDGGYVWSEVNTDASGDNSTIWVTTLSQNLLLDLGESPFNANVGIPFFKSVQTQVYPDYYTAIIQQRFQPYFRSLTITRDGTNVQNDDGSYSASYLVAAVLLDGTSRVIKISTSDIVG